ncbi:hypothetical protein PYW08_000358 [Mythimna loreyi]|uniref:Uncharacterized protein n=1 Tax=Mythimna loreyi TaxID=667449 RepID=A0ACC2RC83_9NEOP|nr:hypothetical protein PYW08_000358 [Mythimna loreyi]
MHIKGGVKDMLSKFHLIHVLFLVVILELPFMVAHDEEDDETHDLHSADWDVRCKLQPNSWKCYRNQSVSFRYYYDNTVRACKTFPYGGCALNYNCFDNLEQCNSRCYSSKRLTPEKLRNLSMEVSCRLQADFGTCFSYHPSYYYDLSTRTCKGFSYSGCGGNPNKFGSNMECMDVCEALMPKYKVEKPPQKKSPKKQKPKETANKSMKRE